MLTGRCKDAGFCVNQRRKNCCFYVVVGLCVPQWNIYSDMEFSSFRFDIQPHLHSFAFWLSRDSCLCVIFVFQYLWKSVKSLHKHKQVPLCTNSLELKPADSLISTRRNITYYIRPHLIQIIKQTKDKQRLGIKLANSHFITPSSNNSTPIDKLRVVLCVAKCCVSAGHVEQGWSGLRVKGSTRGVFNSTIISTFGLRPGMKVWCNQRQRI